MVSTVLADISFTSRPFLSSTGTHHKPSICTGARCQLKDLKRINHELRELPSSEEPTFYDKKIDDVLAHLQAARAGLVEIAHKISSEGDL